MAAVLDGRGFSRNPKQAANRRMKNNNIIDGHAFMCFVRLAQTGGYSHGI
jgi:hypothetical protein